jgi:small conductance mechanosensitive channel
MPASLAYAQDLAARYLVPIGLNLLLAGVVFVVGRWVARVIVRGLDRLMARSKVDVSLRKFLGDVLYAVLLVAVLTASLDKIGIRTTAVIAVLGAAGLAVGLALQGSLSNFAAGVMLIVLRPYKVDDLVALGKYVGRVDAIKVFHTMLITADGREITIPNAQPIENLTTRGRRRIDLLVTVAHGTDLGQLKQQLEGVLAEDPRVEQEPRPAIELAEVTDTGVRLYLRPWTDVAQYTVVATETIERAKARLDAVGLKFAIALQTPS